MGDYTLTRDRVQPRFSMKFLVLFVIAAVSSAKPSKEGPKQDGGLYFDKGEVALACTAGTPVGVKFASALASCANATTAADPSAVASRKKKTCRGRRCRSKFTKKCPSVEDIKKKVGKEMKADLCILKNLGWIDTEGQAVDAVMTADLMTLPTEVSAKLSEEKVEACADKMITKMSQRHERCAKKYNADDVSELSELGLKVASYKCFQNQFAKSCQAFVKQEIYSFYKAKMSPEATPAV